MKRRSAKGRLEEAIAGLYPGSFAMVMATGIISIAAYQQGIALLARLFFGLNLVFYAALSVLLLLRLARHRQRALDDFTSHSRGPGFLTVVAGTCVLARQFQIVARQPGPAEVLWLVGLGLWTLLVYGFLATAIVREPKPGLEEGLNGGWLLLVVSTQSLSVTGARVAASLGAWRDAALGLTLALFLLGGMLYGLIISLIFYRFTFFGLMPRKLAPPYWINMGAMAITTLAGATLLIEARDWPLVQELVPFLKGLTFVAWVTATWWIPLLLALGLWRHGLRGFPLRYHPSYWSLVFPLGMYSAASFQLATAADLRFLLPLASIGFYAAVVAWASTVVGMLRSLGSRDAVPAAGEPRPHVTVSGLRPARVPSVGPGRPAAVPDACRAANAVPFPDYVTCPHCGEPEVEVWCYEEAGCCHNCGQAFEHARPPECEEHCRISIRSAAG